MISETLRCIRIANENMDIKEIGNRIGISSSYISEIEHNKKNPSMKILRKLSELYNMPLSKVMELDEYNDKCTDLSFQKTLLRVLEYYLANNESEKANSIDENPKQHVKMLK